MDQVHRTVDALDLRLVHLQVVLGAAAVEVALQRLELSVPVDQWSPHEPDVEGRGRSQGRYQQSKQGNKDQERLCCIRVGKRHEGKRNAQACIHRRKVAQEKRHAVPIDEARVF